LQQAKQNFRVQSWITTLSIVLFITKLIAYYLTHSLSILSDALESIVNVLAGVIGLYSLYVAAKPTDKDHPYGHGKAEFISAAAEGSLIVAAGFLIIYETVKNIITHHPVEALDTGLILISITAIVNYVAGFICVKIGNKNNSLALQASGKHLQIDTYSTICIIAGLLIMFITHLFWLDKVIASIMGVIIIYNGYKIIRTSLAGIMDEADMELLNRFVDILNAEQKENWVDLHNLRVIKFGSHLHVDCHLTVPWFLNVHEAHQEINALTKIIVREFGDSIELFVHTDDCLTFNCSICSKQDCLHRQHPFTNKLKWTLENLLSNQQHHL